MTYDHWKSTNPEDEFLGPDPADADDMCPNCGAANPRHCELESEAGGACPWKEAEDAAPKKSFWFGYGRPDV
jgi:hypothetical protein